MMNSIVIDDDRVQQQMLCHFIKATEGLRLVGEYSSAISAISQIQKLNPDVIFLDVEMPKMSGIEFLNEVKPQSKVVLYTGNKDYALDGFDHGVVDFLLKPISYERFLAAISKLKNIVDKDEFIFVKTRRGNTKVFLHDIYWIQSAGEYITLHTAKGKFTMYSSMADILDKLTDQFIRVHRSNIINLEWVSSFSKDRIEIEDTIIKVSKTYAHELKDKLKPV
ncbi:MAG: response regulator transcription factor [Crocinitomicaceae bacterium]|nr:response regulator transcription factor [Crocinitomicaceae bacterium]